jgi:hypothetical protein
MTTDRRGTERAEILGDLQGEVTVFQPMTITQIGRGGAQIETPFALHLDCLHEFRLTLGGRSIVVKGRIAHCRISDVEEERVIYRSGVEFVELSDHARIAIDAFLDALQASRMRGEGSA